eukprot:jgi/Picsp_1/2695/NSC_00925-R1_fad dependent oxidoreductase
MKEINSMQLFSPVAIQPACFVRAKRCGLARQRRLHEVAVSHRISHELERIMNSEDLERPEGFDAKQMMNVSEAFWKAMKEKNGTKAVKRVVEIVDGENENEGPVDFDVIVVGGTLGIFAALSLQLKGKSTCVVEKRKVHGRTQEWNISRQDFESLVRLGMLSSSDLESCIVSEWDKGRICFHGSKEEFWVEDILNLGVCPQKLIEIVRNKFLEAGGTIVEHTVFKRAVVYSDRVEIHQSHVSSLSAQDVNPADVNRPGSMSSSKTILSGFESRKSMTSRLLIDCMGHYSPIVKQMRAGQREDGVVLVVGGCFSGIDREKNCSADLLATIDDSENDMQLFWEAFPAAGGDMRTVYIFAYSDACPSRPGFKQLLEIFLEKIEIYQDLKLEDIHFKRILMGGFPSYSKNIPLKPKFDRIIQIGDASSVQSPLSFGGFGALIKHLPRLSQAIDQALSENKLKSHDLSLINTYLPSLSVCWLFQRAMALKIGQQRTIKSSRWNSGWLPANHINKLMLCNFAAMSFLGRKVLEPFLQDSMQAGPLAATMLGMLLQDPITILRVLFQVGPNLILTWFLHFFALISYTALHFIFSPLRNAIKLYRFQRMLDALEWGSGLN